MLRKLCFCQCLEPNSLLFCKLSYISMLVFASCRLAAGVLTSNTPLIPADILDKGFSQGFMSFWTRECMRLIN